jgi:hypothetical protein
MVLTTGSDSERNEVQSRIETDRFQAHNRGTSLALDSCGRPAVGRTKNDRIRGQPDVGIIQLNTGWRN